MSGTFGRRASPTAHERARAGVAERIDGPIDHDESAWVDTHLKSCAECRAVAADYEAQSLELRVLRDRTPDPPRDLWARTAAAIERESTRAGVGRDTTVRRPAPRRRRSSVAPLGALSAALVVVVVVGATLLSQRPVTVPGVTSHPSTEVAVASSRPTIPGATPFSVAAGNVDWLILGGDNQVDIFDSQVNRVCPERQGAQCPPISEPSPKSLLLPDKPSSVVKSPNDADIVVGTENGLYVVPGKAAAASPSPTPSATSQPTQPPATATPSKPPVSTPPPTKPPVASPSPATTPTPVDSPTPTVAPTPSVTVAATLTPSPSPSASPSPTPTPTATPTPTPASPSPGTLEIATDVIVVGESAAYSADGAWFAFSARPMDGSRGPDIYTWHVGDAKAKPVTTDHASVFASWRGARILGSRAVPVTAGTSRAPQSFVLDPVSGKQTAVLAANVWRPSVHPAGRLAVYWDGTVATDAAGADLQPGEGHLVLGPWSDAAASPGTPNPSASNATSTAPLPTPDDSDLAVTELADGRVADWDARWDETGTRLAVWIADGSDPRIGKLTLFSVDPDTGIVRAEKSLHDVRALAGFSIGKGRLAYATPRGQDAKGSRVQVVAWTKDGVGSVQSKGTDGDVVVIR